MNREETEAAYREYQKAEDGYTTLRFSPYEQRLETVNPESISGLHTGTCESVRDMTTSDSFWSMHGRAHEEYLSLTSHIPEINGMLSGKTEEERGRIIASLMDNPDLGPCVAQCFQEQNRVKVWQIGNIYELDGDGRHRVLAAEENLEAAKEQAERNGEPFDETRYRLPVRVIGEMQAPGIGEEPSEEKMEMEDGYNWKVQSTYAVPVHALTRGGSGTISGVHSLNDIPMSAEDLNRYYEYFGSEEISSRPMEDRRALVTDLHNMGVSFQNGNEEGYYGARELFLNRDAEYRMNEDIRPEENHSVDTELAESSSEKTELAEDNSGETMSVGDNREDMKSAEENETKEENASGLSQIGQDRNVNSERQAPSVENGQEAYGGEDNSESQDNSISR